MTKLILINFHFLVPKNFHMKFTNGPVVSEKNKFKFSYLNDLGARSRNGLDLEYSCSFIYSFNSLHLSIFKQQAAIVSEKYKVLTFSKTKVYANKFDIGLK